MELERVSSKRVNWGGDPLAEGIGAGRTMLKGLKMGGVKRQMTAK